MLVYEPIEDIINEINFIFISTIARNLTIPMPVKPQKDCNLIYDNRRFNKDGYSNDSKDELVVDNKMTRRTSFMVISIAKKFSKEVRDQIKEYYMNTYGFSSVKFAEVLSSTLILFDSNKDNNYSTDLVKRMWGEDEFLMVDNMYKVYVNDDGSYLEEANYLKRVPPSILQLDSEGFIRTYCFGLKMRGIDIDHHDPNILTNMLNNEADHAYRSLCKNPVFYEEEFSKNE